MNIGIIGATGKLGKIILEEAVERGHTVTAIIRNSSKLTNNQVKVLKRDIYNLSSHDLKDFDVVVNAFGAIIGETEPHITAGRALIEVLNGTGIRMIVIGGAGSLYVDDLQTTQLTDTSELPEKVQRTALGQGRNLEELRESDVTWTYISPSANFDAKGPRTGHYQLGKDRLLENSKGKSYLSYADCAVAVLDEIEHPQHINSRFTVVSEM
jgi:putative NADH-flavin reductase